MQKTFENFKRNHRGDILKETMKKLTSFFPLHKAPIYGQDHEKQKQCGTSYHPLFELQNIFPKIVWSDTLNLDTVERKGKNCQNI